ncbi:helix-turn-helix transcriptional regulator [Niastella caeni]|uniref:Helix-turn-helix transcriptional regulator n=1 Tax=Niastella caeni TaxID=2569763 RepID=A0A4S8HD25_9BACT|nr:AraC family transcriptional regulator [Niastella caeni]THU32930.1 helix-turn-helix transcriptional regulator [Niastella caeni]
MKKKSSADTDLKKIIKAKEIVHDEFNKPLTLAYVARKIKMDPRKLSRQFKKVHYLSFQEYYIELRASEGIILLLQNKLRINEIARATGYTTTQSFSRMFKKVTGMAPTPWQKLQLNNPRGTYPWIMKEPFISYATK